jgi:hypothetical protein
MAYMSKLMIKFVIINAIDPLQEITIFLTRNFGQKNLSYDFFAPMSNLIKVPFLTSHFKLNHFDWSFWLVFKLNHHDNNIILTMTKYIYIYII